MSFNDMLDAITRKMHGNDAVPDPDEATLGRAVDMMADDPATFARLPERTRRLAREHAAKTTGGAA